MYSKQFIKITEADGSINYIHAGDIVVLEAAKCGKLIDLVIDVDREIRTDRERRRYKINHDEADRIVKIINNMYVLS